MQTSLKLVVRCAVELCAILCPEDHSALDVNTARLLSGKGIVGVTADNIKFEIDHNLSARLFSDYKLMPEKIKNVNLIKELLRKIWLADLVVNNPEISVADLHKEVVKRYDDEKGFEPDLTAKKFLLFEMIDFYLNTNTVITETSEQYAKFISEIHDSYSVLAAVFDQLNGLSYMHDIYNESTSGKKTDLTVDIPTRQNEFGEYNSDKSELQNTQTLKPAQKIATKDSGSSLRDVIRVLEKEKHDLEVKVVYAKKDAIRDIIYALTDYSWGAPLSELYLLSKKEDIPENIKGIIKNLFMALASENIRLVKEKMVGTTITLDEDNQKDFDPYKNEELFLEEQATIYYPGYRCEREIMVRPVVRKKNPEPGVEKI